MVYFMDHPIVGKGWFGATPISRNHRVPPVIMVYQLSDYQVLQIQKRSRLTPPPPETSRWSRSPRHREGPGGASPGRSSENQGKKKTRKLVGKPRKPEKHGKFPWQKPATGKENPGENLWIYDDRGFTRKILGENSTMLWTQSVSMIKFMVVSWSSAFWGFPCNTLDIHPCSCEVVMKFLQI